MPVEIKTKVSGLAPIQKLMAGLSSQTNINKEIIMPALKEASPFVIRELAQGSPRSKGWEANYRRKHGFVPMYTTMAMNVNTRGRFRNSVAGVRIGPKYPEGAQAHLVESGTVDRFIFLRNQKGKKIFTSVGGGRYVYQRKLAGYRGAAPAQHWISRTWDRIESTVESMLLNLVLANVNEAMEKK